MSEFDPSQTGNFNHRASSEPFSEWSETTANTYIYLLLSTPIPSRETLLLLQCPTPTPLRLTSEATTRPITPVRQGLTKLLYCCLKWKDAYLLGEMKQEFYTSVLDNGLEAPVTPQPPPRSPQYSLQDKMLDRLTDLVEREFKRDLELTFEVTGKIELLSSDV
ncbi:hypothetical protein BJX76DRAFT_340798 [Aspergillus varians]